MSDYPIDPAELDAMADEASLDLAVETFASDDAWQSIERLREAGQ